MIFSLARLPAVAALVILAGACAGQHFVCRVDSLLGILPTARVPGEDALDDELVGGVDTESISESTFGQFQAAFEGDEIGQAVVWYMERGLDNGLRVIFRMQTPARPGSTFEVTTVEPFRRFWGVVPPGGPPLTMGVDMNDFTTTSIRGTARVVGVDPFRLEVDVVASDGNREIPIRGTLTFRHDSEIESCFE